MPAKFFGVAALLWTMLPSMASAVSPTADEMIEARQWAAEHFDGISGAKSTPPFSFLYDDKPSNELLGTWKPLHERRPLDGVRTEHTLGYTDAKTGLAVRCVAVEYRDFPTVEWTVYFRNGGQTETSILADIQPLDVRFQHPAPFAPDAAETRLYHQRGSQTTPEDYQPLETVLAPGAEKLLTSDGGRPCNGHLPYFNLQLPGGGRVIVAVGWPGQWAARFARDEHGGVRIRAGQERTHFKLLPGEEVRTPLVVLQFWKGDRVHAQNVWRRWMLAHNLPRPGGKLPAPQLAGCSSHQFGEMIHANTANQKLFIDRYVEEGLKPDYWWMDAGWYQCQGRWPRTGTWEVDTERFPGGLRPISDHAHAKGVKTIVWFEPERVRAGMWLAQNHPDWLLPPGANNRSNLDNPGSQHDLVLNMGNPEALHWLVEHVDRLINEQGIDLYRQDFNINPLGHWRNNDAADRQGITEIKHVMGYLAYWDELRRRHPNMLIDSCAGGGRRNDLETLRRAVPLLRSDYVLEPVGNQGHTYGIAFWMPYYGTGVLDLDPYLVRSVMCPSMTACFDMRRKDLDYALARRLLDQWRQVAHCYFGDYYPLTPYNLDPSAWMAWQFDCPESGNGLVQAFRRAQSAQESLRIRLQGLDANAVYTVTNFDVPRPIEMTGRELTRVGFSIGISTKPGAAVIRYQKK